MTTNAIATRPDLGEQIEQVLIGGDLSRLSSTDRVNYYNAVCASLGLNPLTKPFEYLRLNGKEMLYAKRDCTEQLRKLHGVSVTITSREVVEDCYVVTARATDRTGRTDESIGVVPIANLKGEARANAMMKGETKAKRRVTLSIAGLGLLDELEVDGIPGAERHGPKAQGDTSSPSVEYVPSLSAQAAPSMDHPSALSYVPADDDELLADDDESIEQVPFFELMLNDQGKKEWVQVGLSDKRTKKQNNELHALRHELRTKFTDATFRSRLKNTYGKTSTAELTKDEAQELIGKLRDFRTKQWHAYDKRGDSPPSLRTVVAQTAGELGTDK